MPSYVRAGIRKCARIRALSFADPDAAERGFKVTLAPRSFNTFVLD